MARRTQRSLNGSSDVITVAELCRRVMSTDFTEAKAALVQLRNRISGEIPPIEEVLESGCVPRVIQFLSYSDNTNLQYDALWVLTNLVSGTDPGPTDKVVLFGVLPQLVSLLSSPSSLVCEQAAWTLANIEGTSVVHRDEILELGFVPAIIKAMQTFPNDISLLRNAIWAFHNGCRWTPPPSDRYFIPTPTCDIFPTLTALFAVSDQEITTELTWSLCLLTDIDGFSEHVIAGGMCAHLVRALECADVTTLITTLRAVGNIATGSNTETQAVIDAGVLPRILPLLNSAKKSVRKETCWLLSNIAAGTREQVRLIAVERGIFERIIELLLDSSEAMDVREEAAFVVCNAATKGSEDVTNVLFNKGALRAIVELLGCLDRDDDKILLMRHVLGAIETAMLVGTGSSGNHFKPILIELGAIPILERIRGSTCSNNVEASAQKLISMLTEDDTSSDDSDKQKPIRRDGEDEAARGESPACKCDNALATNGAACASYADPANSEVEVTSARTTPYDNDGEGGGGGRGPANAPTPTPTATPSSSSEYQYQYQYQPPPTPDSLSLSLSSSSASSTLNWGLEYVGDGDGDGEGDAGGERDAYGIRVAGRTCWTTTREAEERAAGWNFAMRAYVSINAVMGVRYDDLKSKPMRTSIPAKTLHQIELDIPRTFTDSSFFPDESSRGCHLLRNLLVAFAALHPGIGYTQSLNDLAAASLLGCGCFLSPSDPHSEEYAFWVMNRIVNIIGVDCYHDHMLGLLVAQGVLEKLIHQHIPGVTVTLNNYNILWNLWDRILSTGSVTPVYAACVALLQRAGLECSEAEEDVLKCAHVCHTLAHTIADSDTTHFFRQIDYLTMKIGDTTLANMLSESRKTIMADTRLQLRSELQQLCKELEPVCTLRPTTDPEPTQLLTGALTR
ncbi:importin subunit alpha-2 [Pelomyxa schiedti]|nr:importin subunit alpha-2 [Pelomyxa schiedti]